MAQPQRQLWRFRAWKSMGQIIIRRENVLGSDCEYDLLTTIFCNSPIDYL